jgi:hypothetical protein
MSDKFYIRYTNKPHYRSPFAFKYDKKSGLWIEFWVSAKKEYTYYLFKFDPHGFQHSNVIWSLVNNDRAIALLNLRTDKSLSNMVRDLSLEIIKYRNTLHWVDAL